MGYDTKFTGKLRFANEPTVAQLRALQKLQGEDKREHPEWEEFLQAGENDWNFYDLRVSEELDGIEWDDSTEKTYGLQHQIAMILRMFDWLRLDGTIKAQGEDVEDRYEIKVHHSQGLDLRVVKTPPKGRKVQCPDCRHTFYPEDNE